MIICYFLIFLLRILAHDVYLQDGPVAKECIYGNALSKMCNTVKFFLEKTMKSRGGLEVVLYSFIKHGSR